MDVDPDKSNTEILIEMAEDMARQLERIQGVTESIASAFKAFSQSAETVDNPYAEGTIELLAKHEQTLSSFNEMKKDTAKRIARERAKMSDYGMPVMPASDEPEEAEPTIAERLKAGGLSLLAARDLPTDLIEENIAPAKSFDRIDNHGAGRQFRDCYDPFTVASFTIFKSGKANTGGKDSDLRSAIKAILESEGFDVRC